jgi:hypothetical protein
VSGIRLHPKRRILGHEALEGCAELFLVALRVWLNGHRNHGLRERRRLEANVKILMAQGVTRDDILDADKRADVT